MLNFSLHTMQFETTECICHLYNQKPVLIVCNTLQSSFVIMCNIMRTKICFKVKKRYMKLTQHSDITLNKPVEHETQKFMCSIIKDKFQTSLFHFTRRAINSLWTVCNIEANKCFHTNTMYRKRAGISPECFVLIAVKILDLFCLKLSL